VAMHCCTKENKLTCDAYFIVKHIILQIVRSLPFVYHLLLLQDHNYFAEMLSPRRSWNSMRGSFKLQEESADLFVKFCKVLS